jgi:zinc protease
MKISLNKSLLMLLAVAGLNAGHAAEVSVAPTTLVSVQKLASKAPAWPHEGSDLEPDSSIVYGHLENGLRYAIQPTKSEPGQASLRLRIDVGSLYEQQDEQGLAHFLEHMAFNGMRRFPAGQTIENFQRMGMSFGAHNNAQTSFDTTTYIMNLPRAGADETGEVLKYFRDVLDGMNLDAKEIEKERGVILREMSARNVGVVRSLRASLEYVLPETMYPKRFPVGTAECVTKMPRERFVNFYNAWYRPERATVIAVGDFKTDDIRRLIEREFSDAAARGPARANPDFGKVTTGQGITAHWATVRDISSTTVSIANYRAAVKELDTRARQKQVMIESLGQLMLKRRLNKLSESAGAILTNADANQTTLSHAFAETSVTANCAPGKALEAVVILENEVRRVIEHGFTQTEFADVTALMTKGIARLVAQSETKTPEDLADELVQSLAKHEVVMSPAGSQNLIDELFKEIDATACSNAFRAAWTNDDIRILVSSEKAAEANIADKLVETFKKSRQIAVAAPQGAAADVWAYTDFGTPGKIVEQKQVADLDVIQAKFANNVRINIKRTDFIKDTINVGISFGGGVLEAPADKPGLIQLTKFNLINGGLKKHTMEELNRAVADKNVRVNFVIDEDAFMLGGRCSKADLETQLQLCTAYLMDPEFRPTAAEIFQKSADSEYSQLDHSVEGLCQRKVANFYRNGDTRFGLPDRETLRARTSEEARAWMAKPLSTGYMEITIVGDLDPEQVLALVAKTLGALPEREAVKPAYEQARIVSFPKTPQIKNFGFVSETARAMIVVAWPTADARNNIRSNRLGILAEILNDRMRLKIREELGAVYTPSAYSYESSALTDFGLIAAEMLIDPTQATEIGKLVTEIAADLRDGAISDDEFARAVKQKQSNLTQMVRSNAYWMSVLGLSQSQPQLLDDARQLAEIYRTTTKDDVQALAKAYLSADRAAIVTLTPEKASDEVSVVPGKEAAR